MELRIATLMEDNLEDGKELLFEHGFSVYIEYDGKHILFDTGQTGNFLENAAVLGKSLEDLDCVVISHGHYDHSGGVLKLADQLHKKIPMYVGKEFFDYKYSKKEDGTFRFNGNGFEEEDLKNTNLVVEKIDAKTTFLSEQIVLFKDFQQSHSFEILNPAFVVEKEAGKMEQDDFIDEQVLGMITEQGLVVLVGCSHIGICNILKEIHNRMNLPIVTVIGGTHLIASDEERVDKTIQFMKDLGVKQVAVSHCTGELGVKKMEEAFSGSFMNNHTGTEIIL